MSALETRKEQLARAQAASQEELAKRMPVKRIEAATPAPANGGDDLDEETNVYAAAMREFEELYKDQTLEQLCNSYKEARDGKAELKKRHTRAQAAYDLLSTKLIPDAMEKAKVSSVTFKGVGRVSLTADVLVSAKSGMKDKLFGWLKKHKLGDLIQDTVNSSTLKAFVKARIKDGKDYPTEFLNVTPVTRTSLTKVE